MTPFDRLSAYLQTRASFTPDDLALVRTAFVPRTLEAGEFLQRGGDVARHAAFVAQGCLRSYVIDAKGKEHIVMFAPEEWWIADTASLASGAPSQFFYEAIEPSELLLIEPAAHQMLVERVPGYASSFRSGLQRHAAAKDQRIVSALATTAEERYSEFLKTYPSIASRVPQWMLASYLGVTPETISRIRRSFTRKARPHR